VIVRHPGVARVPPRTRAGHARTMSRRDRVV
jgi:hypothetical protein